MRIVFFGTSSFAAKVLAELIENHYEIVAVVTRPDRLKGRHLQVSSPPVKETAHKLLPALPIFQPEKASLPEFASVLQTFNADLFIVVAYGEIIRKNLLEMPKKGCVNIHASLLPKWRGAAPIHRSLMAGDKETGITLIEMSPQMDAGDILAKAAIPISEEMNFGELEAQLSDLACRLLFELLEQYQKGTVSRTPQDHSLATLAPKIIPEDEKIDWKKPASVLYNQIRAFSPSPGAWCLLKIGEDLKRLKIKKARLVSNMSGAAGSLLTFGKEGWIVACGQEALQLINVQLEGKKEMSAEECIRGMHQKISLML